MPIQLLNPAGLSPPVGYSQVAVASGSRMVFTAGEVARDVDGNLVGPNDYAAQTRQAEDGFLIEVEAIAMLP